MGHNPIGPTLLQDVRTLFLSSCTHTKERPYEHIARWWLPTSQEKRPRNEIYFNGTLILEVTDT